MVRMNLVNSHYASQLINRPKCNEWCASDPALDNFECSKYLWFLTATTRWFTLEFILFSSLASFGLIIKFCSNMGYLSKRLEPQFYIKLSAGF